MSRPSVPEFDVLCVGLACVDLTLGLDSLPAPDQKVRATSRHLAPGGPAAVAAAQIARLGGRVAFSGRLGDPATEPLAAFLLAAFASAGIDTRACILDPGFPTPLAAVLLPADGRRTVVSHRTDAAGTAPAWPTARVILTDGHRPEWTPALVAHAHDCGALLVLDAGSRHPGTLALAPHADHLVASETYALCGRTDLDWTDLGGSPDAEKVVTCGERGLLWRAPDASGRLAAFPVTVADTNGAGDAFHGAYAWALARDLPRAARLRLASAAGALACTRIGAWSALGDRSSVEALAAGTAAPGIAAKTTNAPPPGPTATRRRPQTTAAV